MRVQDVMTTDVATAEPGTPLKDVARELVELRISGMPVVDGEEVVGVISEADLLAKEAGETHRRTGALGRLLDHAHPDEDLKLGARLAGEAMTAPAVTVEPYWTISTAANLMLERGINRLPVVQQGRLVGIVTRADLVRAFARSDAEIEREIREQLEFQQALWLDGRPVEVQVRDGEVVLTGRVEQRTHADLLPKVIGSVPGVVGVRSELVWSEDDA